VLQYKIPQNVGIEDKIVGPFSIRQLIILAVGGGISYVLFAIASRIYELNVLEYILIALPAIFSLMAAMLKIHNVSFTKYVFLTLEMAIRPKRRMWDHRGIAALVQPDLSEKKAQATQKAEIAEEKKNVNLRDLSSLLDSGGFKHVEGVAHEDIDQAKDDDLITEAYFGHKKEESSTENMYWRTRDMQKKKLDILAKMPKVTPALQIAPVAASTTPPESKQNAPQAIAIAEKKESVVTNLAKVIQEARQNNQDKTAKEATTPPAPQEEKTETADPPKRKRKRKRKPKAKPIRPETQIDNTQKNQPAKLVKKDPRKDGETSIDDLKEGGEIEFNLH